MMYFQQNPQWKNDEMAMPGDTLGKYGCVICSLSNITLMENRLKHLNPKQFNAKVKSELAYKGLDNHTTPIENYSYFLWNKLSDVVNHEIHVVNDYRGQIEYSQGDYYIFRIIKHGVGHYVNMLRKHGSLYTIFDTWDGEIYDIHEDKVTKKIMVSL